MTRRPKSPPAPERQAAFKLGLSAESRAAAYLLAKGYRIAARRWRSPAGEIDIVARRGKLLVFVEVKARASLDDAAWSVTQRTQRRVAAAAAAWLAEHPDDAMNNMRFDAILVAPRSLPRHIQGAFEAERGARLRRSPLQRRDECGQKIVLCVGRKATLMPDDEPEF